MPDTTTYRNSNTIRTLGIKALAKELGPVGMAHFLRQFDEGDGDYTKERGAWLSAVTMEEIDRSLRNAVSE